MNKKWVSQQKKHTSKSNGCEIKLKFLNKNILKSFKTLLLKIATYQVKPKGLHTQKCHWKIVKSNQLTDKTSYIY